MNATAHFSMVDIVNDVIGRVAAAKRGLLRPIAHEGRINLFENGCRRPAQRAAIQYLHPSHWPEGPAPDRIHTTGGGKPPTPHPKDQIGQLLMDENVRSVWHRHDRDTFEELPGPVDNSGILAPGLRQTDLSFDLDPIVLLQQLDYYEYQSCECPEWCWTGAYAFCQGVSPWAEAQLPSLLRQLVQNRWSSSSLLVLAYRNTAAYD